MLLAKICYLVTKTGQDAQLPGTEKVSSLPDERDPVGHEESVSCRLLCCRGTENDQEPEEASDTTDGHTHRYSSSSGKSRQREERELQNKKWKAKSTSKVDPRNN